MRQKIVFVLGTAIALMWFVQMAQAGAIRYAGEQVGKGSAAVAQMTADAAGTAAADVQDAGKASGSALKTGATAAGKGVASAPATAVHGTRAAASKVWQAVW